MLKAIQKKVPILYWLPRYSLSDLPSDIIAGLTVFVYCVPQTMAYSVLVGLPAIYGLYSSIVPMIIYACIGTSRQLSLAPMAITSLLLATAVKSVGYDQGSDEFIAAVMSLSLLTGLVTLLLAILRMGSLVNLISPFVLSGFLTASGLTIGVTQLNEILGFDMPRYRYILHSVLYMLSHLHKVNAYSMAIGFTGWAILYLIQDWRKRNKQRLSLNHSTTSKIINIAAQMSYFIFIVIGIIITRIIFAAGGELRIVGHVPSGLITPGFDFIPFDKLIPMLPNAVALAFVAFVGNWSLAKKYSDLYEYEVDASQELWASGVAITVGVFFRSFVGSGGLGRTAVNVEAGARTQLSGCICAVLVLACVLFLTPVFYYIPKCVLAAVIEVSIASMIDFSTMVSTYTNSRRDFAVLFTTFIVTLFVGEAEGLFIGILISLGLLVHRNAYPHVVHLGKIDTDTGTQGTAVGLYKDVTRYPRARQLPGVAILRMEAALFFGNAAYFKDIIKRTALGDFHSFGAEGGIDSNDMEVTRDSIADQDIDIATEDEFRLIKKIVIDASTWLDIDLAGVQALLDIKRIIASLQRNIPNGNRKYYDAGNSTSSNLDSAKSSHGLLVGDEKDAATRRNRNRPVFPSDKPQKGPPRGYMIILCAAHERVIEMLQRNDVHFVRADDLTVSSTPAIASKISNQSDTSVGIIEAENNIIRTDHFQGRINSSQAVSNVFYPVSTTDIVSIFIAPTIDIALALPLPELQHDSKSSEESSTYDLEEGRANQSEFEDFYDENRYKKYAPLNNDNVPVKDEIMKKAPNIENSSKSPLHNLGTAIASSLKANSATISEEKTEDYHPYQNRTSPRNEDDYSGANAARKYLEDAFNDDTSLPHPLFVDNNHATIASQGHESFLS